MAAVRWPLVGTGAPNPASAALRVCASIAVEAAEVEIEELLLALGYRGDVETSLSELLKVICLATCPDTPFAGCVVIVA